jgi:hypothetical protein
VASGSEGAAIADGSRERGCNHWPHPRDRHQALRRLVLLSLLLELLVEIGDPALGIAQLVDLKEQDGPGTVWKAGVVGVGEPENQLLHVGGPLRRNDTELGHVTADRVDQLNALADQRLADAVENQ